ncbi:MULTISPECIES: CAP domain-containing protein [Streptomyces]|uniref:CAP domain-containing protein n=1 Tax=Streptomyces kaempferi TaxID=333725 RepID=A0ABW3XRM4_9ACTN|nr:CAP domain-containing protein [Streptomyces sp. NBC_01462]
MRASSCATGAGRSDARCPHSHRFRPSRAHRRVPRPSSEVRLRKHGRKFRHGTAAVAAVALGALAIPSAAMAYPEGRGPGSAVPVSAPHAAAPVSMAVAHVVGLVNRARDRAGCSPVTLNTKLSKAARRHSADMARHRNMSHWGSDGSGPGRRIARAGFDWSAYGENVAYGYSTSAAVMAAWMSSPGHRHNILTCGFREIGVGLAQPGSYWTQDFGTARRPAPRGAL